MFFFLFSAFFLCLSSTFNFRPQKQTPKKKTFRSGFSSCTKKHMRHTDVCESRFLIFHRKIDKVHFGWPQFFALTLIPCMMLGFLLEMSLICTQFELESSYWIMHISIVCAQFTIWIGWWTVVMETSEYLLICRNMNISKMWIKCLFVLLSLLLCWQFVTFSQLRKWLNSSIYFSVFIREVASNAKYKFYGEIEWARF